MPCAHQSKKSLGADDRQDARDDRVGGEALLDGSRRQRWLASAMKIIAWSRVR